MKKTFMLLILLCQGLHFIYAQPIENIQVYASSVFVDGSTPADPDFYEWEHIANNLQGVDIDVIDTEVKRITIQQNNAKLSVNTRNHPYPFNRVEIKYDDDEWIVVSEETTTTVGWLDLPETFQTIGIHSLQIRYQKLEQLYSREYEVFIVS